ncbi:hypothetical protein LCGC14_0900380 [marine sediment metagenome]|uniref:Uncharacterized protein n=1 Tax=marine sediment metagenome TaxID=412755 RepID=A0A0F9RFQ7_9ZZZZ
MLDPNTVRTAIILCMRAPLKGEEARDAAAALDALEETFKIMTAPPPTPEPEEIPDGDDARISK